MNTAEILDNILNLSHSIEAVVHLSRDGLPLSWRCRKSTSVEEITSLAAGLFVSGSDLGLLEDVKDIRLSISTDHGSMQMREFEGNTCILVLFTKNADVQSLEMAIDEIMENTLISEI